MKSSRAKKPHARLNPLVVLLTGFIFNSILVHGALALTTTTSTRSSDVVIQFDGSLRKPADPGFSTASLGWMAACAASVRMVTGSDTEEEPLLYLGGRDLTDRAHTLSSGEVEYEGVLLALQGLSTVLQEHGCTFDDGRIVVTIRGDCKTVIQQLQGRALSRKLEAYPQQVERLLQTDTVLRELGPSSITYEHIPREQNVLCDRLCAAILHDRQAAALEHGWQLVSTAVRKDRAERVDDPPMDEGDHSKKDRKKRNGEQQAYFTLEMERAWQFIPISQRPELYRALVAPMAAQTSQLDAALLLEVAQRLRSEVGTVWRKATNKNDPPDMLDMLEARALAYEWKSIQLQSTTSNKHEKDLTRFENKHRYLWKKHARLVQQVLEKELLQASEEETSSMPTTSSTIPTTRRTCQLSKDWPLPVLEWQKEYRTSSSWSQDQTYWHDSSSVIDI